MKLYFAHPQVPVSFPEKSHTLIQLVAPFPTYLARLNLVLFFLYFLSLSNASYGAPQ
jgi:hypothetical protein